MKCGWGGVISVRIVRPPVSSVRTNERGAHVRRFSRGVHTLLGLLLLAAAGLKLSGMNVAPFAQYGWFTAPWVQTLAVEWEVVLGLWLLSGAYRAGAWLAALGTFAAFAAVSGYLGWVGQASCGCFGVVRASPWHAFAVDLMALVLLTIGRPNLSYRCIPPFAEVRGALFTGIGVVSGLALLAGVATLRYGSIGTAVAELRGDCLTATPDVVDFGAGRPGEILVATVVITNRSDRQIRLVGGTSDCSCVATEDLPVTIPAGKAVEIRLQLKIPVHGNDGESFARVVDILTADDAVRSMKLGVSGRVSAR